MGDLLRFADEFSLLVQLRSPQRDNRSILSVLGFDKRVLLQLRIGAHAVVFKGPQLQHYEWVQLVCTTCFNLPVARVGLSFRHYSLFEGSRWREDFIFQVNFRTCQAQVVLCCDCVCACVCVFMCLVVPGEVYWQALLLCDLQRTRQFITLKQQTGLGLCTSDI